MGSVTYNLDDSGPYSEDELREKLRAHRAQHGDDATLRLPLWRMTEGGTAGERLDVGQFLPPIYRVDFRSEPGWGDDNSNVAKLRAAVEASDLAQPRIFVEPQRNETVVEFDVEARGLAESSEVGLRELRRVLDDGGISFPIPVSGSTGVG